MEIPLRLAAAVTRRRLPHLAAVAVWIGLAPAPGIPPAAAADDYQAGSPLVYLFDTHRASPRPLTTSEVAAKAGWSVLAEDVRQHQFRGDVVLLNDKLTVVFRRRGPGAEVYSQTPQGPKYRLVLSPVPDWDGSLAGWDSVKIRENGPAAVLIETKLRSSRGGSLSATWRLTTGQQILKVRSGESVRRLLVWGRSSSVVVPDFFADDMVFGPAAFDGSRLLLPTENSLLCLLEGGHAMAMCVWESSAQPVRALLRTDGRRPVIGGCEIRFGGSWPVWVALMEGPQVWHQQSLPRGEAAQDRTLDWKPPFAARWRADFVQADGVAESFNFAEAGEDGGEDAGKDSGQDAGQDGARCRFEGDRAVVRIPPVDGSPPAAERAAESIVVYPIDRSRATPLVAFCPTDVLRNTLGIGPCEYLLQMEGLASKDNATAERVIGWIEKQLRNNTQQQSADQIRRLLRRMTDHVGRAQERIAAYSGLAGRVRELCAAAKRDGGDSAVPEKLDRIARRLAEAAAAGPDATDPQRRAAELAKQIIGLLAKEDALAELKPPAAAVRRIGTLQDRTLSKCRMTTRWLQQQARTMAAADPTQAALAGKILMAVEQARGN